MAANHEKSMFELIDRLNADEVESELAEAFDINGQPTSEEEAASIARIKARTLARLQQEEANPPSVRKPRRKRKRIAFAAAAAAALLAAVGIGSIPDVQAELRKVLRFLPGFGMVQEGDPDMPTYVLEKPYVQAIGQGELTVDGIVLQPGSATITLRSAGVPEVKQFEAEIGGRTYTFNSGMLASSGDWYGSYSSSEGIRLSADDAITLHIHGTAIGPLTLVPPKTADDLDRLGSSDIQQEVKVTAFPTRLDDGTIRVQMISTLQEPVLTVDSYGVSPLVAGNGLHVEDVNGAKMELVDPSGTLSYSSDFRFRESPADVDQTYTVVVPYIEVSDREAVSGEVEIPLPEIGGSQTIDVATEIRGFPVRFTRIERTGDTTVDVDVDVQFDPAKPQSLQYFWIRYAGSPHKDSFSSTNVDETSRVVKTLHLDTKPGQSSLRFSLTEPHFVIKGPWRLSLKP